ncbi:MAG TPA: hypothetical protein VK898_19755 [Chloroflexota bacterium]|nr:hypothetical protein [Chloroflexota bacterium]
MIARLWQLPERVLFRPGFSLLLFGSLSLLFNWLWIGSGLFLGRGLGLSIWLVSLAATAVAAMALIRRRLELAASLVLVVATIVVPTVALIALRWKTGAPILMHDGAYQTEEAIRLLLAGHDPYGFDYTTTSMRLYHWYVSVPVHPSLYHFLYAPLAFLLPLPAYVTAHWLGLPFDVRLMDLAVEAVAAVAILQLAWRWEWKYVLVSALFLDPFFYLAQGRNDVWFLTPIVLGVLAWQRNRLALAALAFGTALAFKPFAVFFIPLLALLVYRHSRPQRWSSARLLSTLALFALPAALSIGPFFLWNPGAYWADTVAFVTGTDARRFPIQGYGLSAMLLLLKIIPNANAYFPFTILQLGTVLPVFVLAVLRLSRTPTLAGALRWGTLLLTVFLFFSRFVNDNYIAAVLFLAVLAGTTHRAAIEQPERLEANCIAA